MNKNYFSSYIKDNGCKEYDTVSLKQLGSRKKLECYYLACEGKNILLFSSNAKSRILSKEIDELENLASKFLEVYAKPFDKKVFFYTSPICSKAIAYANKFGWSLVHVSL